MSISKAQLDGILILLNQAYRAIETVWREANSTPAHRAVDDGYAIIIDVPSERATYFLTKPGQPMHPGVVRRTFVEDAEGISLRTEGWSFGSQRAFKQWLDAFKAQSAEIQARLRKKK